MTNEELKQYIVQRSQQLGIDPGTALKVASGEGGLSNPFRHGEGPAPKSQDSSLGSKENSYGPFQLYISGNGAGLGDRALAAGIDPRTDWKGGVDFALNEAKNKGWGQWYGAKAAGITGMDGIGKGGGNIPITPSPVVGGNAPVPQGVSLNTSPYTNAITPSAAGPGMASPGGGVMIPPGTNGPQGMPIPGSLAAQSIPGVQNNLSTPQGMPVPGSPAAAAIPGPAAPAAPATGLAGLLGNDKLLGGLGKLAGAFGGGGGKSAAPAFMPPPNIQDNSAAIASNAAAMFQDLLKKKRVPGLSLGGMG